MTIEIQRGKVIPVDRHTGTVYAGQGLMKGLGVIWKHWVGSFKKLEGIDDIKGTFTVEYPEERLELPEAYRNMPILLFDESNGHELCTSCFQCERICPPQVIHISQAKDLVTGKAVPAAAEFIIEYDACMSCGFCAEVCPFDAIKMDHEYELSTYDHPSLTVDKAGLNRPISYYEAIAPVMWSEVKDSAYKKLQGNIKRRSGTIGIAPQMVEKLKTSRAAAPTATAAAPAAATAAPRPAAALPPAGKNMPEDKAAKLAAIRAANVGKSGGSAAPVAAAAPVAEGPAPSAPQAAVSTKPVDAGKNMSEDKAARLAAIRAANSAKGGGEAPPAAAVESTDTLSAAPNDQSVGAAGAGSQPPVGPSTNLAPPAAVGKNMSEEKAARLAAIRAAKANKGGE